HRDALALELESLADADERMQRIERDIADAHAAWTTAAAALTASRRQAGDALAKAVVALIAELGMAGGRFEVALEAGDVGTPDPNGAERVDFLVSANAGQ